MKPLPVNDLDHILSSTTPLWERVRGKRIFITGGTGFFGAWLLESFLHCNDSLRLGASTTVLCRDPDLYSKRMPHVANHPATELLRGDIATFEIPEAEFPFVIHAAAPTSADSAQHPEQLLETLIQGTRRILQLASSCATSQFLFVSSGAVYGKQPAHILNSAEDDLGGPNWLDPGAAYAEGKRVAELLISIASRQTAAQFRIARCFAFVGPHLPLDQHFAIGNFIADALANRVIHIRGDGTPLRSYMYASDLAIWLWSMLLGSTPGHLGVWNVGSDEALSIRALADLVVEELRPQLEIRVAQQPDHRNPPPRYVPAIARAHAELGLKLTVSLREAIRRTAEWHTSSSC